MTLDQTTKLARLRKTGSLRLTRMSMRGSESCWVLGNMEISPVSLTYSWMGEIMKQGVHQMWVAETHIMP